MLGLGLVWYFPWWTGGLVSGGRGWVGGYVKRHRLDLSDAVDAVKNYVDHEVSALVDILEQH